MHYTRRLIHITSPGLASKCHNWQRQHSSEKVCHVVFVAEDPKQQPHATQFYNILPPSSKNITVQGV
jgi:hypothetical protein